MKANNTASQQVMSHISFRQSTNVEVDDAFYEHLVYENLENIVQKYTTINDGPLLTQNLKQ